jgi:hypothetical protein
MQPISQVTDALLKKLSTETQLVGQVVSLQEPDQASGVPALVLNVIILPRAMFYRHQFMSYYAQYRQNAVKALKELTNRYPEGVAFELDLGYVLSTSLQSAAGKEMPVIKMRESFTLISNDLAAYRQETLKNSFNAIKREA